MPRRAAIERSTFNVPPSTSVPSIVAPRQARSLVRLFLTWFARNARDLPWRRTLNPYAIWISEIMLQQTQVKTVVPYWVRWLKALPTARALSVASQAQVLKLWEGLGYYSRARNLQKAAQIIVEQHDGRFPENFDDVLALPGIGRYTAGAICSISFNQPTPILDGNVIRVLTRVFGVGRDPREKATNHLLWQLAERLVVTVASISREPSARPAFPVSGRCSWLNQSLMELGALVCVPKEPRCFQCPLRLQCAAFRQNRIEEFPCVNKRARPIARRFVAFAIEHRGRWLVRQRPGGVLNAHLWEFPNLEVNGGAINPAELFAAHFGRRAPSLAPLLAIKHSITRYRISLEPFRVELRGKAASSLRDAHWLVPQEIEALAFASAHRKVWERIRARRR
jgi:A/G-specific adenine glycosylase